jgi:hypothetical protein
MHEKKGQPGGSKKRSYRAPKLKVYGDIAKLTRTKGGFWNDNAGKPKTYLSGSKA